ncbi:hypothetical protein GCM10007979_02140 [Nocardioides albus]|nr:hypothetical protein GCM10007979_02140 [Nocardioides albus]
MPESVAAPPAGVKLSAVADACDTVAALAGAADKATMAAAAATAVPRAINCVRT